MKTPDFGGILERLDGTRFVANRDHSSCLKVEDGWLVGFDSGEWGGALYWFSEDEDVCRQIVGAPTKSIVRLSHGVYAVCGLSHMEENWGLIARLHRINGVWEIEASQDLPACPHKVVQKNDGAVEIIFRDRSLKMEIPTVLADGGSSFTVSGKKKGEFAKRKITTSRAFAGVNNVIFLAAITIGILNIVRWGLSRLWW